jgi:hypothetical protein
LKKSGFSRAGLGFDGFGVNPYGSAKENTPQTV